MTIYEKLFYVQQNLKAPKNQYNQFGDYHYRSCEDIQETLKPLMAQVKALLLVYDDIEQIGDRYYVKSTAVFQDTESNTGISNTAFAREADNRPKMDAAQITGSCSSYARKYALNGLFCIDDAKDPDSMKNDQQDNKGSTRQHPGQKGSRENMRPGRPQAHRTGTPAAGRYMSHRRMSTRSGQR